MNIFNDNFNSNIILTFSGRGLNDTSNSSNNYLKNGIGFQLLSNNSNYKELVIADTSNINSNYFASLRIAVEKSQISLKSITSNNIIQPLIINSNIYITSNIGIGITNPLYNIDAISNINTDNYFIKGTNISNIFTNSNFVQSSILNLSNITNSWIKSTSTSIYTNSNVGINKSNPIYNLDVAGNINFTGNLTKNGVLYKDFSGNFNDLTSKPDIIWYLNGINAYNNNFGNIGINTSTPAYKLDVVGDINFTGRLLKNKTDYSVSWDLIEGKPEFFPADYLELAHLPDASGSLTGINVYWSNIQGTPSFVKIATTGSYSNLTDVPTLFSGDYSNLRGTPTLYFRETSTGSVHIYNINAGNTGIGNNNPQYKLDVNGDINFTGNLRKNGTIYSGDWNTLLNKPPLQNVALSGDFNELFYRPDFYPTKWEMISGNIPPIFDFEYSNLKNVPFYAKTNWSNIDGKPDFFSGDYSNLKGLPIIPSADLTSNFNYVRQGLSEVAFTGNYNDLKPETKPRIFSGDYQDLSNLPNLFTSNYSDLLNPPYIAFQLNAGNIYNVNSGNVGVNNTNPSQKLDVNGNINISTGFNYMKNGIALTNTTATFSDIRIKTNIADIDDLSGLDKIMKVEPKNYNYIDTDERGSNNVIGFIAQQIREVIPEAITIGEEFIPNIYKYYQIISINTILIDDANINKLFIGNVIKIKVNNISYITKIIDKINKTIKIDTNIDVNSKCFIYGIKINDFHFIDKSYIYTLNVCATQELCRRIDQQQKEIDELKSIISKIVS